MKHHHTALICSDYATAKHFYTEILGFTILAEHYRPERQSYKLDLGIGQEYVLELFTFPNPPKRITQPEACGLRHISFTIPDPESYRAELQAKGVSCEPIRIDEYAGKSFFFIFDPDGLPIEFYQE
ncbi:VOC family protein [Kingella negevensis]|uniref:SMU1112c/YaeR family gloxylase I-like metalloprotein n=1 Tax=Kingella negevensis TaxID=1522312 RepID=UPI002542F71E|nr:VOC family protein [Kingella negevensis]MDK4685227.1 VOC family protein [Kingella negevensis]MDK4708557.1 VOC family protein [Kingella negevensis]MDK4710328.1 VOC family protein [Kingella negevensis]WII92697.1 VOC family protein [Kingella negevensis]